MSLKRRTETPRVFLSYARSDGEDLARALRERLEAEGIPLWQDRIGMEGGQNWWSQIVDALNLVEFMVLLMTPEMVQHPIVREEWRYARQQGVCVYPVKGDPNLDFTSLPRWMRDVHFYDLEYEWTKFVHDLNTRCQQPRVPFMVEDVPTDFVQRPQEFDTLVNMVLGSEREGPIAITAALRGAGGYGKTTMAKALCHDERIQEAFDDGILWVTLGEKPSNLVGKVEDLIYILSKERPGFTGIDAASAYLAELLKKRHILFVIDDVWHSRDLKPFLQGAVDTCTRLITTRDDTVLPPNAQRIQVDAMSQTEAVKLLSTGLDWDSLSRNEKQALRVLASRLGEWALLLKLVNGVVRERVNSHGQALLDVLAYIGKSLDKRGLTAFDNKNAQDRSRAVDATLSVSFELLSGEEYERYKELAIFPEDVNIPWVTIQRLWGVQGGMDDIDTEILCERLYTISLLLHFAPRARTIRLHDVVRSYLRREVGTQLVFLHRQLLDTYALQRWSELPHSEPYLWDHLATHLIDAGCIRELVTTVKDLRYLATKMFTRNASAAEADLIAAEKHISDDRMLSLLKRNVVNTEHLFNRRESLQEIEVTLHSRLCHLKDLSEACRRLEQELVHPFVTSWHSLPDLPHPALIRTLQGHSDVVAACSIVSRTDGDVVVSASSDGTLKVWDVQMGTQQLTLRGHTGAVNGCAIGPKGDYIVSASSDGTLKIWDAYTGTNDLTLYGHTDTVNACAVSPIGDYIVSASADGTLRLWDAHTGEIRKPLCWHEEAVNACAVSPTGDYIVSASSDSTLKIWDVHTGKIRKTLCGHSGSVSGCAVNAMADAIVSSSADGTLKVWDAHTGAERSTLYGHRWWVMSCVFDPKGTYIVSASADQTLKMWDTRAREESTERFSLLGHSDEVRGCAVSPLQDVIVSASADETLKVWDRWTRVERLTLRGHTGAIRACAVSPAGDYIVSASVDHTLKIWNTHTGVERLILSGHTSWVHGCAVSSVGDIIVSASGDHSLKVWDAQTGAERFTLRGHTEEVRGCAISLGGDMIVSASSDKTVRVWDAQTGAERFTLCGHTDGVHGCAMNPGGDLVVSASVDRTLKVWNVHTMAEQLTLRGHTKGVTGCAVSPTNDLVISTSEDGTLKVWDISTGKCLTTLLVDGELFACAFCPDGNHLVAGGKHGLYFLRLIC